MTEGSQADDESLQRPVEIGHFMEHVTWLRGHCVSKRYHAAR